MVIFVLVDVLPCALYLHQRPLPGHLCRTLPGGKVNYRASDFLVSRHRMSVFFEPLATLSRSGPVTRDGDDEVPNLVYSFRTVDRPPATKHRLHYVEVRLLPQPDWWSLAPDVDVIQHGLCRRHLCRMQSNRPAATVRELWTFSAHSPML